MIHDEVIIGEARRILKKRQIEIGSIADADYDEPEFYSFPQCRTDTTVCVGLNRQIHVVLFRYINSAVVFVGIPYAVIDCNELFRQDLQHHTMKLHDQWHMYENPPHGVMNL